MASAAAAEAAAAKPSFTIGGDDEHSRPSTPSTPGPADEDPSRPTMPAGSRLRRSRFSVRGLTRTEETTCAHFLRTEAEVAEILQDFDEYLKERTRNHLGYPYNLQFDSQELAPFLQYSINNLGDPFVESNYGVHSRMFEVEVLDFFASIWEIPLKDYWGYTTTCGTEGNLLGILYGREKLPDGVLYCSRDSHYSVPKAGKLYRIPVALVKSQLSGEMDYDDFREQLRKNKDKPAIVSLNAGTTVKGAVDSLHEIKVALEEEGFTPDRTFIHCDGALAGMLLPFHDGKGRRSNQVSFAQGMDSICISGHKMLGCPMPCGVVITRKEHMQRFCSTIEYLNSNDTTIMGSRNGQASLAMWHALQKKNGMEGLTKDVVRCFENAVYLHKRMVDAGYSAMLNKYSTTIVFEKPSAETVHTWQLACVTNIAHVVVMPSSSREKLDRFFADYVEDMKDKPRVCVKPEIGVFCLCPNCKPPAA